MAAPAAASRGGLQKLHHFVVIYEENHSFDNHYGGWERVDGLRDADRAHTKYHHQPLSYYKSFAPGTAARKQHLRDEEEFEALAKDSRRDCRLEPVSLIKPIGAENEHPGYAGEHTGSGHLVELLQSVQRSACAKDTMVIVTYDEFGGQWDHVPPAGQGTRTPGPHDNMGPSTRIPALTLAPGLRRSFTVDPASHDTTSIMATIENRFDLRRVATRDGRVQDLSTVFGGRR